MNKLPTQLSLAASAATESVNSFINQLSSKGAHNEVIHEYASMLKLNIPPDNYTFPSLLKACTSLNMFPLGLLVHQKVVVDGFSSDAYIACSLIKFYLKFGYSDISVDTALVDMYSKCGYLKTANKCFNMMSYKDMVSWGAIIATHGSHGQGETALKLYSSFYKLGLNQTPSIFLAVLSSCNHCGLIDEGLQIYHSMEAEFVIAPDITHNACIIDLLSRAGRVEEAYSFDKKTFTEPVVEVLGILVDACRVKGDLELGAAIGRELLLLKPGDAGNYFQLAHCSASMNNWDGVGEGWTQMRSLGLRKLPG